MSKHYTGRIVKPTEAEETSPQAGDGIPSTPVQSEAEKAQTVLETAEEKAAQIIADAEEKAALLLEEAEQQGLFRGRKAACLKFLELSAKLESDVYSLEGEVAGIVSDSVERILAQTPQELQLAGIVRAAIRDFRQRRALVLHVSEEDLESVRAIVTKAQNGKTHPISEVVIAQHLSKGECQLSDGAAELRIDVETQLSALRHALLTPESEDRMAS